MGFAQSPTRKGRHRNLVLTLFSALVLTTIVAPFLLFYLGRRAFGLLAVVPAVGFFWVLQQLTTGTLRDGNQLAYDLDWMPAAHLTINLRMDALSALFSLIILGCGRAGLAVLLGLFRPLPAPPCPLR